MQKIPKLYCYADETGQDTEGQLFIVVAVVVANERDTLNEYLQRAESASGIGKRKWTRTRSIAKNRDQYLQSILVDDLKNKVYYSRYTNTGTGAFEPLTVLTIAKAIKAYCEQHHLDDYKVSIMIDGLKRSEEQRVGRELRELGIKTKKIRGARDESEPIIRLADRLAGLVRDTEHDGQTYEKARQKLEKRKIITKL